MKRGHPALRAFGTPALRAFRTPALRAFGTPALRAFRAPVLRAFRAPALRAFRAPALRAFRATASALLLAGCAVKFVSDYDEQIDSGLSQVNTDTHAFIARMVDASGTPAGLWSANKDFYINEEARIDTLLLRAKAHRVLKSCAPVPAINGASPQADTALANDDCDVVQLQLVRRHRVDADPAQGKRRQGHYAI